MIKAIIVDDEHHCIESLSLQINNFCHDVQVIDKCRSAKAALDAIRKLKPDLVFLDIEMPVMNGFELLENLPEISFAIIFTTSYNQYAIKAIRFSALDYLLKPVDRNELIQSIKKVQEDRHLPVAEQFQILLQQVNGQKKAFNKIAVPTADGFELIPAEQLLYCEANDNYTYFYLSNKTKIVACRTLKEIEDQLKAFPAFVRVHNSYVVNLNEVRKYVRGEGGYLIMSDGSSVNVSRTRKEALLKHF